MTEHPPTLPAVRNACARLAASRSQLRLALRGPVTAAAQDGLPPPTWWSTLLAVPAVRVLHDAVRNWWTQHPWHSAGTAAAAAVNSALQPVAQRHPWALAAAALLFGGLLAAGRPWRWRAQVAAGAAGTLPRLLGELLTALPVASWLVMLAALAKAAVPDNETSPPAASTTEPPPPPPPEPAAAKPTPG
ncbi:MAG: hypothetical protein Q8K45_01120 [Rubrivivax sp.]|nr:hypothetical protein [Rubrivivax sp.]